ncbi:MAG: hypothetical protein BHK79_02600 [Halanaerobium sp. MDAL1]|nr:MAG: hypothetical protein BHK79_02600 [Halanaerobium sp. MDAL1]
MNNITVLKIGGSFINNQNLHKLKKIVEALKKHNGQQFIIVAGGGQPADFVRKYDTKVHLKADSSHFAAIAAMELNAYLLADYFNDFSFFTFDFNFNKKINIFLPLSYYRKFDPLPHSWNVSSDSIALELSQRLRSNNLFLFKQRIIKNNFKLNVQRAADSKLLDSYFPILYQQSSESLKSFIIDFKQANNMADLININKSELIKDKLSNTKLLNKDTRLRTNSFNLLV